MGEQADLQKKSAKKLSVLLYQEIGEIEILKQELVKEIFIFRLPFQLKHLVCQDSEEKLPCASLLHYQ